MDFSSVGRALAASFGSTPEIIVADPRSTKGLTTGVSLHLTCCEFLSGEVGDSHKVVQVVLLGDRPEL